MIQPPTLKFLSELELNNNKPWFQEHKEQYQEGKKDIEAFMQRIWERLSETDMLATSKMFRIYRDVRFSKDKTPYKPYFSGYFTRMGKERRGGYYFSIQAGDRTIVGGGFYDPNKEDLFRIRKEIEFDGDRLKEILAAPEFARTFGELLGDGVKTAPKGFSKDHPHIDLIRKKQFYAMRTFTDKEVLAPDFTEQVTRTFLDMRPFLDYMSEVLTTNLNGEKI
jgi:uncharacterized protein (TIGR02453 family)